MSIPGSAEPLLLAQQDTGYTISRSLRFNASDSAYCSRTAGTPSSAGTYTLSIWVKRSALNTDYAIFGANSSSGYTQCYFTSDNKLRWYEGPIPGGADIQTTPVFRDTSAWYHFVFVKTGTSSMTIYQNGIQVAQTTSSVPSSSPFNTSSGAIYIGYVPGSGFSAYANSYLADIHFIDGQALTPSSFAETNTTTGQWVPKAYSGSYGTNGFQLKFADNSNNTAATLGKDTSGNGNNWTPNNLSVTAGAGNDSLVDTPTSYGTGNSGGDVRGNYATLNPLDKGSSVSLGNGNLEFSVSISQSARATLGISSGKWYWEVTASTVGGACIGISGPSDSLTTDLGDVGAQRGLRLATGAKTGSGTTAGTTSTFSGGDIAGLALNLDTGELTIYKNGVSLGVTHTGISGVLVPTLGMYTASASSLIVNFGQRPFAYTAPSGFKALCDTNLPAPVVAKPNTVMDVATYTGDNTNNRTITTSNSSLKSGLVWIKSRSAAYNHTLFDSLRGAANYLVTNSTGAENFAGSLGWTNSGPTGSNSFKVDYGTNPTLNELNSTYVGWVFDAGSSTVTNTQGSITSQVRANPSAGFSIVTYTGTGANATVGHNLGVAPSLIIIKSRSGAYNWIVYHQSEGATKYLSLNQTIASTTLSTIWNNTAPTSALFTVGSDASINGGGDTLVAYCFAPVSGYSSFGSYTGNGSTDGPFVYTGFRPRWIMFKQSSASGEYWEIYDTARGTYNISAPVLYANDSLQEAPANRLDILSNGFKPRTANAAVNASGSTYVYVAFAEIPFQYARAR